MGFEDPRFLTALFTLLSRYEALGGAGMQAALHAEAFQVLKQRFGVRAECFASPLNCRLVDRGGAGEGGREKCSSLRGGVLRLVSAICRRVGGRLEGGEVCSAHCRRVVGRWEGGEVWWEE